MANMIRRQEVAYDDIGRSYRIIQYTDDLVDECRQGSFLLKLFFRTIGVHLDDYNELVNLFEKGEFSEFKAKIESIISQFFTFDKEEGINIINSANDETTENKEDYLRRIIKAMKITTIHITSNDAFDMTNFYFAGKETVTLIKDHLINLAARNTSENELITDTLDAYYGTAHIMDCLIILYRSLSFVTMTSTFSRDGKIEYKMKRENLSALVDLLKDIEGYIKENGQDEQIYHLVQISNPEN